MILIVATADDWFIHATTADDVQHVLDVG